MTIGKNCFYDTGSISAMANKFQCELISWTRVVNLVVKLAHQINKDGFHPDIIIAIGRGGYTPARILADYLDIMNLTSIKVEHYTSGTHRQTNAIVKYQLSLDISGQKVLVVDDVSDSGDTFAVTLKHIEERSTPDIIKTAVLHHKTVSEFVPDYYAAKVIKWRWLIYPWAQVEDISGFIAELDPCPDKETIAAYLKQAYGIKVPSKVLEYVVNKNRNLG